MFLGRKTRIGSQLAASPFFRFSNQGRGWSAEEIVRRYPYLSLAEVHAALTYYHDHREEIDREIEGEAAEVERLRRSVPESPLLRRLRARKAQRNP